MWTQARQVYKSGGDSTWPNAALSLSHVCNLRTVNVYIDWLYVWSADFEVREYMGALYLKSNIHLIPDVRQLPDIAQKKGGIKKRRKR